MFRLILASALAAFACAAGAAPFLVSQAYPASENIASGSITVNGGAATACSLETVSGGVRNKCDLAGITTAGTYTLVQSVCRAATLTNGTNTATFAPGGCADGVPFSYKFNGASVTPPAGQLVP